MHTVVLLVFSRAVSRVVDPTSGGCTVTPKILRQDCNPSLHTPNRLVHTLLLQRLVRRLDLILHALDGLKVLDGLHVELGRRVLVDDDEGPGVELEGGERPEVVDALLDGLGEREGLALAGDDDDDLARVEDGRDADGERHARDGGDVVVKEARVGEDGVVCERLDARARGEGGACVGER